MQASEGGRMSGTRGGLGRIVAMGIGAGAGAAAARRRGEARAGKYAVAQCGWYVGADADWADTTGGAKFRPDAFCVPPAGADPFDGAHLKSFTRDGQATVSGTRFARWRWDGAAGHRHHPGPRHLVARPPRRDRAADRRRHLERRLRRLRRRRRHRRHPARLRRRLLPAAAGDRGPAALRQGRKQVVQPRPGLLVGGAGADDHGRGRPAARPPGSAATSPPAAGGAAPRASASGAATPAPASASAKRRSTAPASTSPSTPARRR